MADKDVDGVLSAFESTFNQVVITNNGAPRAMEADALAQHAEAIFGSDRVIVQPNLADAISQAIDLADAAGTSGVGVIVTGSVVTAGAARALIGRS